MKVYSERGYINWVSWGAIFEWEDSFAKEWGTEVECIRNNFFDRIARRLKFYIHKLFPKVVFSKYRITDESKMGVLIIMDAEGYYMIPTGNIIPIYLDFSRDMVDTILKATEDLPAFFVASKDIYNDLKERGCRNVYFISQCVSDQYYSDTVPEKKLDVVQIGRKNPVLHEYMLRYSKEHPGVEYIYQSADASLSYISTTRGNIGSLEGRTDFLDVLRSARVSLVSSPKCDGSRDVFGGADLITARFYESAVMYCHMIGRYTDNEESRELELDKVCPNVRDYSEFEALVDRYLDDTDYDWKAYREFIMRNLASARAGYIKDCIVGRGNEG